MSRIDEDALAYHEMGRPGKTEVIPTKPCLTARDLSLAYSPGVAAPCLAIKDDAHKAYRYTNKGNLVAVLSNGTAVLGLGDIGALAGKPVMEGKGVLFKRFAHVDVFDIEVQTHDPLELIRTCQVLEPTFGGINLEDIKAPECFLVEEALRATMSIPVFHDDQHGTAIISGAALLNALHLADKKIDEVKVVVNGAGASALACARFFIELGAKRENFLLVDTKGVVYAGRTAGMNEYKAFFAVETPLRTLEEAMQGSDVFLGCSVADCISPEMLNSMAVNPIIFALANPDPEIPYDVAKTARPDAIVATGRSDFPNQVNNVLGFPYIFRGALDVRATCINEEMKIAAAKALAELAREPVPVEVSMAYGGQRFVFGPDYIIPKPFDSRLLPVVASAVAKAACESNVAREPLTDWEVYKEQLNGMTSKSEMLMQRIRSVTKTHPKRIVFTDGESPRVMEAVRLLLHEKTCIPILLGRNSVVGPLVERFGIDSEAVEIINPAKSPDAVEFAELLYQLRQRSGYTPQRSREMAKTPLRYGLMMLRTGKADALLAGAESAYSDTITQIMPHIKLLSGHSRVAGFHILLVEGNVYVVGDTLLTIDPTAEELAEIAVLGGRLATYLGLTPKISMLSFSNFGDSRHPKARKVKDATAIVANQYPEMVLDGEMHGDVAVLPSFAQEFFPHSRIQGDANVLICPDIDSANIAAKLVGYIGQGRELIGPIIEGLEHPINVVSFSTTAREMANLAALACYRAAKI